MRKFSRFTSGRIAQFTALVVVSFLGLTANLGYLQLAKSSLYRKLSQQQTFRRKEIPPRRGEILDRKKRVLAMESLGGSVFLRPSKVNDALPLTTKLAPLLSLKEEDLLQKLFAPRPLIPLRRDIDYFTFQKVQELVRTNHISGIELQEERKRVYPQGHLLSHVLGFVNIDEEPLEGCEKALDRYLGGKKGIIEGAYDVRGNPTPLASRVIRPPKDGADVILTIDLDIQRVVEDALDKAWTQLQPRAAIAIVMDPRNGEILALANRPTFDPNNQSQFPPDYKRNRAVTDLYEVGSVLKPFIIASALQEGVITPSSRFYCEGKLKVGNKTISCVVHHRGGHGSVTPERILEVSCNVGAAQVGLKMGSKRLYNYLKKFGFSLSPTDELLGARPGNLSPPEEWGEVRVANVAFGQGISITPLHLISAFCALVNGGILYKPHILKTIIQPDGKEIHIKPKVIDHPISPEVANMVRNMLEKVVESKDGTAYGYANIQGVRVGGKTGTAQKVINGRYSKEVVASFAGFLPAPNPRLVILVLIDQPKINRWGATAAAPIFKQIAQRSLACLGYTPQPTPSTLNTLQAVAPQRPKVENPL